MKSYTHKNMNIDLKYYDKATYGIRVFDESKGFGDINDKVAELDGVLSAVSDTQKASTIAAASAEKQLDTLGGSLTILNSGLMLVPKDRLKAFKILITFVKSSIRGSLSSPSLSRILFLLSWFRLAARCSSEIFKFD